MIRLLFLFIFVNISLINFSFGNKITNCSNCNKNDITAASTLEGSKSDDEVCKFSKYSAAFKKEAEKRSLDCKNLKKPSSIFRKNLDKVKSNVNEPVLMSENFEDKNKLVVFDYDDNWSIEKDDDGNSIYCNKIKNRWTDFNFGRSNWRDYTMSFKIKFATGKEGKLETHIRKKRNRQGEYRSNQTKFGNTYLEYVKGADRIQDRLVNGTQVRIGNSWTNIKLIASGNNIAYYVNGKIVVSTKDDRLKQGAAMIAVSANSKACVDNIVVKNFDAAEYEQEVKKNIAKQLQLKQKMEDAKQQELAAKKAKEEVRKKKLAEQEKITQKIKDYKRHAVNFYKDVEEFVKLGGKIDLVKLSQLYNIKPDPKKSWNSSDLKTYENLRKLMSSVSEFVTYEKQMIGERLKKSFALKDQSIAQLEKNLDDLKGLMRKMFGSSDVPKITRMISDIESSLANFNQSNASKLIVQTTNYISSKFDKPKIVENKKDNKVIKKVSVDQSWSEFKSKMSIQQGQFCQLTDSFFNDLDNARKSKNEIKVNIVHKQRQEDLDALIPGGEINNWIFKVVKIDQVEDGSAAVVLSLQCKSFVGSGQIHTKSTWRSKNNKEWRATIPYNDRRFRELAKLNAGEFVVASGLMLEIGAYKPGQKETFYASQPIGEHPLTKGLNLKGELFVADLSYIAALN